MGSSCRSLVNPSKTNQCQFISGQFSYVGLVGLRFFKPFVNNFFSKKTQHVAPATEITPDNLSNQN